MRLKASLVRFTEIFRLCQLSELFLIYFILFETLGIFLGGSVLCDSYPKWHLSGWQLSWVAVVSEAIVRGQLSGWQLSWVEYVLGGSCQYSDCPRTVIRTEVVLDGIYPRWHLSWLAVV